MTQALQRRDQMHALVGMAKAALKGISKPAIIERAGQILLAEGARNPKLAECTPISFAQSVQLAGQLGLEPSGPLGHFYLIPRRLKGVMTCTAIVGYKGLLELARRSGELVQVIAGVVYADEIEIENFTFEHVPPSIVHKGSLPTAERKTSDIVAAYCIAYLKDGGKAMIVLPRVEIERRGKQSQTWGKDFGPWSSDYAAMARKTAIRALLNGGTVPMGEALVKAMIEDDDYRDPQQVTVAQMSADLVSNLRAEEPPALPAPAAEKKAKPAAKPVAAVVEPEPVTGSYGSKAQPNGNVLLDEALNKYSLRFQCLPTIAIACGIPEDNTAMDHVRAMEPGRAAELAEKVLVEFDNDMEE